MRIVPEFHDALEQLRELEKLADTPCVAEAFKDCVLDEVAILEVKDVVQVTDDTRIAVYELCAGLRRCLANIKSSGN